MRTQSTSTDSRRAFQPMAHILVPRSLFASGGSEKGQLSEQCLCISRYLRFLGMRNGWKICVSLKLFLHSSIQLRRPPLSSKHLFTSGLRNHNQVLFLCLSCTSLRPTQSPEIPRYLNFYGNYSLCINGGQLMIKMAPQGMKIEKYSGQRSPPEMQNQSKAQWTALNRPSKVYPPSASIC